jgi:hypothetical protein
MLRLPFSGAASRSAMLGVCVALFGVGCGSNVPVSGTVTMADGTKVTSGGVSFVPDKAKGNNLPTEPVGQIGSDGVYQLTTNGQPGAPPGAYKIVVSVTKPSDAKDQYSLPSSLINRKYSTAETSDLPIEVKDNAPAGTYDLKLDP